MNYRILLEGVEVGVMSTEDKQVMHTTDPQLLKAWDYLTKNGVEITYGVDMKPGLGSAVKIVKPHEAVGHP